MSPRLTILALVALSLPSQALAMSCSEITALLAAGRTPQEVVAAIQADGPTEASTVQCLVNKGAPMAVVVAARNAVPRPPRPEPEPQMLMAAPAEEAMDAAPASPPPPRPPMARPASRMKTAAPMGYGGEQASTEDYTDYGVNGTTLTAKDAQSTFAIDVDTASYTIARSKLNSGQMPPVSAVRVEEFVNYFPYDDAGPEYGDQPFAVHLEVAPSPMSEHHILRVGIKGKELAGDRAPVHLTFLVDTSGSMGQANKLPLAKRALHELVNNLGPQDTVALATYAGSTRRVLEPTPVAERGAIHEAIEALTSGGGTAMASGMENAYQMAAQAYKPRSENRVIVLSDGDANIGNTTHEAMLATIQGYAERGITMTTVGFGMGNYKDTTMEQLANKGDGNYYYIDNLSEARRVFGVNLSGTIETIAKDVKVQVEFNPAVVRDYRLIGYENRDIADRDFRNDAVDAGELGSGHTVTALYELTLADDAPRGDLATVRLRAKRPGPDSAAREWTTTLQARDVRSSWLAATPDLRVAWAVGSFAELLRNSPYTPDVSYEQLAEMVVQAGRGFEEDEDVVRLMRTAARLERR